MPLPPSPPRREIHHRTIDMKAYAREDGLFDVEARLIDTKTFPFQRLARPEPVPAGDPVHDLWLRVTVNGDLVVQAITAVSDVTPYPLCKEAESTLAVLVGERIGKGWSSIVKQRLRGAASCTHLMEMLIPMATTAFQGIRGLNWEGLTRMQPKDIPVRLDSCYAYGAHRDVVKVYWPELHRPLE